MSIATDLAAFSETSQVDAREVEIKGGKWINEEWEFADGSRGHFATMRPVLVGPDKVFSHYAFESV
jgi:hypothetical protein